MRNDFGAPYVLKRFGQYYMFLSQQGESTQLGLLRAASPLGPWSPASDEPIMFSGAMHHDTVDNNFDTRFEVTGVRNFGPCSVFEGPDNRDWICSHYWISSGDGHDGSYNTPMTPKQMRAVSLPLLGIEPLGFLDGMYRVDGPTSTEQYVMW